MIVKGFAPGVAGHALWLLLGTALHLVLLVAMLPLHTFSAFCRYLRRTGTTPAPSQTESRPDPLGRRIMYEKKQAEEE
jgi:hypothetical protein